MSSATIPTRILLASTSRMKMKDQRSTRKVITGTTSETRMRSGPAVSPLSGEGRGV
jgi:hypothetical protein